MGDRPGGSVILQPRAFLFPGLLTLASGFAEAQSWLETRIEIEALEEAGDIVAASALGDTLIEQISTTPGATSEALAEAHLLLARIQSARGEHIDAEAHSLAAIDIYEADEGPLSTRLIEPFIALGQTYYVASEFELALGAYQEARNIGRRAWGLLNDDQIGILDQMALTQLAMGDFDEARALQLEAIEIVQRARGDDSIAYLDAHYRYAEWLRSLRLHGEAEREYFAMQRIINRNFDSDPKQEIRLLRTRAMNRREATSNPRFFGYTGLPVAGLAGTAPGELEKALRIVGELETPDPVLHAAILRDIGDWNVAYGRTEEIREPYEAAWRMLDGVENGAALQREWFAEQTFIYAAPLYSRILVTGPEAPRGRVDLAFTIDEHGRTDFVEIVGAFPAGLIDDAAARQIMSSRFRPRVVDGELVTSDGVFTWEYRYNPQRAVAYSGNQADPVAPSP